MRSLWTLAIAGGVLALVLAALVSPFASPHPDGLERVAEDQGFAVEGDPVWALAWAPDYEAPGVPDALATSVAGVAGTAASFGALVAAGYLLARGRKRIRDPHRP